MSDYSSLVHELFIARLALGLTQRQVAAKAGLRQNQIGAYEREHWSPRVDNFAAWADACGLDVVLVAKEPS